MGVDHESLLLIQFSRAPLEGAVKTRMLPYLSAAQACELHCEMTLWTCRQLLDSGFGDVEVSVAGDPQHALFNSCLAMGACRVSQQHGADLGQRMYDAIQRGLAQYASVILVGSDCPGIDPAYLRQAVAALHKAPVVVGPATDGGYVLLGARAISEDIFKDIPWGSDQVYAKTRVALASAELEWIELSSLTDIDTPEDLPVWKTLQLKVKADTIPG
jgi:rSAM/selenodomain-associated transferase 1